MDKNINFPNLGLYLENVGKSVSVFGYEITYYGITVAIAMLVGICVAARVAKRTGQDPDTYFDIGMIAVIGGIIGARIYYVIFSWENYKDNLLKVFNLREGGLAIYGGVIAAVAMIAVYARVKKKNWWLLTDTACIGLVLGQIIGRWANFFNREAFGGYTDSLFAMQLPLNAVHSWDVTPEMMANLHGVQYIQVHPTFLYESLWNIGVLIVLLWITKRKSFDGQVFLSYILGYGLGRAWIEGLRTDQLLIPVLGWPVSQVLAIVLVIISAILLVEKSKDKRRRMSNE